MKKEWIDTFKYCEIQFPILTVSDSEFAYYID